MCAPLSLLLLTRCCWLPCCFFMVVPVSEKALLVKEEGHRDRRQLCAKSSLFLRKPRIASKLGLRRVASVYCSPAIGADCRWIVIVWAVRGCVPTLFRPPDQRFSHFKGKFERSPFGRPPWPHGAPQLKSFMRSDAALLMFAIDHELSPGTIANEYWTKRCYCTKQLLVPGTVTKPHSSCCCLGSSAPRLPERAPSLRYAQLPVTSSGMSSEATSDRTSNGSDRLASSGFPNRSGHLASERYPARDARR